MEACWLLLGPIWLRLLISSLYCWCDPFSLALLQCCLPNGLDQKQSCLCCCLLVVLCRPVINLRAEVSHSIGRGIEKFLFQAQIRLTCTAWLSKQFLQCVCRMISLQECCNLLLDCNKFCGRKIYLLVWFVFTKENVAEKLSGNGPVFTPAIFTFVSCCSFHCERFVIVFGFGNVLLPWSIVLFAVEWTIILVGKELPLGKSMIPSTTKNIFKLAMLCQDK